MSVGNSWERNAFHHESHQNELQNLWSLCGGRETWLLDGSSWSSTHHEPVNLFVS